MTAVPFAFVTGPYRCVAARKDRPWGHALEVSVDDAASGDLLNSIVFACHPEFTGFETLQALSTDQLIGLARAQLASGALDARLADPQTRGWTLFYRFELPAPPEPTS
ncbi:hypothetical protein [Bradyrhizobium sp. STM 3809]|uniref:hypothetical protein n=1 Tax=Bradyrhizobium sp. STM 3809 TaxID=551936 RepID=UPI0002406036|nr:hypothetical protein [Bradyrhizobium sp. STM 3809]CCD99429.1 hypothetical protein BRAS3809_270002 [Bradyrhizobium sp. STM 3809]